MEQLMSDRKYIVFGVEHYNPLGLIRSLGEEGLHPTAIILKGEHSLTSKSKYIKELYSVEGIDDGYKVLLKILKSEKNKPFVFTADDKVTCYLDDHYDDINDLCYFFNAGERGRISYYINKSHIMDCARKHGLNVLDSVVVKRGEIPLNIDYPVITKPVDPRVGAWKGDMHICHDEVELKDAYKVIETPDVILQKYIVKKNEYCLEGFSINHGADMKITIASTYDYNMAISYSPLMTVSNFKRTEIKKALDDMYKEIGFEGIFEIEFLVDQDDNYYFGEINFRNSTWSYASTCVGMNLPCLWIQSMLNQKIDESYYKEVPDDFHAMVELTDFKYRVLGKRITLKKWLLDFKNSKCRYYIGKHDIKPFFCYLMGMVLNK